MATSKSLKSAVKKEVKQAETAAKTGDVQTIEQGPATLKKAAQPVDLPTNTRRHLPPE